MQVIRMFFFLAMMVLVFACESSTTAEGTEEATEETMDAQEPEAAPSPTTAMSGDQFEVVVVKDGIASPRKELTGTVAGVDVTVNYGSPSVKGREIFGGLEPYGQVWRTGANEATTIEFGADVMVEGSPLAAGKYALFTIPMESGDWTVIFSSEPEQFGAFSYQEEQDALRVMVTPEMADASRETMDFMVEGNEVILAWDTVLLSITVDAAGE